MKRVTGIGGIFFSCRDPQKMLAWYNRHLGLDTDETGTNFEWRQAEKPEQKGFTQWYPYSKGQGDTSPSKEFMINYRVENLEGLVSELKKEGVEVIGEIEVLDYGKFIQVIDPEGNKIELWEPNDTEYDKIVVGRTK